MRLLKLVLLLMTAAPAIAQEAPEHNQLGMLLGAEFIADHSTNTAPPVPVGFTNSIVYQLNFAHRLKGEKTQLWIEFPSAAAPSHTVSSSNPLTPVSLATFYTTPSFRLNLRGTKTLSPWFSFGGGYALFEGSEKLASGADNLNRYTSTGALQFGAGVDVRTRIRVWKRIGLRGEIRDFYTFDTLMFTAPIRDNHEHNVIVSGGLIVRF